MHYVKNDCICTHVVAKSVKRHHCVFVHVIVNLLFVI